MARSLVTVDLGAIRHNARVLADRVAPAALWAVVKADGYGHGAADAGRAALSGGASALCVATVGEGVELRTALPGARIVVLGPGAGGDVSLARDASLELTVVDERVPEGVPVHLKLDTGMGRWGLGELPSPGRDVVGLMTHLATSDSDRDFARAQLARFLEATASYAEGYVRHVANSAAALTLPETRLDATRCGIALYGIDPFGEDAAAFDLRPALRWESELAQVKRLAPGDSTGYGRRFAATEETWIGIVPVGYADGFRRDLTGTEVVVGGIPAPVVGTVSMDAVAVRLPGQAARGTPVTLVGDGATLERHARVAETIGYELACGIRALPGRGVREARDE
ncbi:MAG TPA: alanine racemase [Gaiella sp.]|nr:alanine racemase [Gaiella sp.]